jgi:hypothetical protein
LRSAAVAQHLLQPGLMRLPVGFLSSLLVVHVWVLSSVLVFIAAAVGVLFQRTLHESTLARKRSFVGGDRSSRSISGATLSPTPQGSSVLKDRVLGPPCRGDDT